MAGDRKKSVDEYPMLEGYRPDNYRLIESPAYALAVGELRSIYSEGKCPAQPVFTCYDGSRSVRPFTLEEVIEIRVNDYETRINRSREERMRFFRKPVDTCTAVAYKGKSSRFRIIPACGELITISTDFRGFYIPVDYDSIDGIEMDSSRGRYNCGLTKSQISRQHALRACVNDLSLRKAYRDIVLHETGMEKAMGFWVREKPMHSGLSRVFIGGSRYSIISGCCDFTKSSCMILAAGKEVLQKTRIDRAQ